MDVLIIDYKSTAAPKRFCESLKQTGFAVLKNHPIPSTLINDAYQQWRAFFNSDTKMEYQYQKPSQAGYFPFRTEKAKDGKTTDLKEFYHFYPGGHIPPTAKPASIAICNALGSLAAELLHWIEDDLPSTVSQSLSMPLKNMIDKSPNTVLRILHYPPLDSSFEKEAVRAAPHEDINLITLLPAATAPGLEVLDINRCWHKVSCDPGSIVVNVGDMLQLCTQHYYKSTTHRVINPISANENISRYSMPFFLHPRPEVRLSSNHTAETYLHERLTEIGIY